MKQIKKDLFKKLIREFDFVHLFNELGWNYLEQTNSFKVDDELFNLNTVAIKAGFRIMVCPCKKDIPSQTIRKKIEHQVTRLFQEHLIIYTDAGETRQIWQIAFREPNKPIRFHETHWNKNQDPELLYQRTANLFFTIDEEDKITIVDVAERVSQNFQANTEKVTKKFYERFKKEHSSFKEFIEGLKEQTHIDWYASLMLNRLMFVYFIQKKGFLNNQKDYLQNKLKECKKLNKKFYQSFYRSFLLQLFHKGLGQPHAEDTELVKLIGKVPYLNGGLFDVHELERENHKLDIDDKAFERIFAFFDEYEWHLDTRASASGKEINPDVIGFIFEKYINERAQMGAYYTKEDITEYISKNCIIPWLFDEAQRNCKTAFEKGSSVWKLLQDNPDRYIYDSVKKGVNLNLPKEIEAGIDTTKPRLLERRKSWNHPADEEYALPTELWREVVERRNRYKEVHAKLANGEITQINDFITYNLNIRQFAQDVLHEYEGHDLIQAFYTAIAGRKADPKNSSIKPLQGITILDPTCGSGAFLFAALNVLEPLYEECIERMKGFVEEDDKKQGKRYPQFRTVLEDMNQHSSKQYYIYKSIILNNLYGVDLMKEAVEIAKLRLFLKLVSVVDLFEDIEPLPDIDFNIKTGNTLVGFTSLQHAVDAINERDSSKNQISLGLIMEQELRVVNAVKEKAEEVAKVFGYFKQGQLFSNKGTLEHRATKIKLQGRLDDLNDSLNTYMAFLYQIRREKSKKQFETWLENYQPFHWFAEYYEIIQYNGGFDIIIGNPPYVEYSEKKFEYKLKGFETEKCSNLYGYVIERCYKIMNEKSLIGMIIPISAFSNASMLTLQKFFKKFPITYISNFHQRPAALFEGVLQRLSIFISRKKAETKEINSSIVYRWNVNTRENLFPNVSYITADQAKQDNSLKVGYEVEKGILKKYFSHKPISALVSKTPVTGNAIHYRTAGGGYWVTILNTPFATTSLSNKSASFLSEYKSKAISAILNSNLFWWYYTINFDQFNFKDYMIFGFRFNYPQDKEIVNKLIKLSNKLEKELLENATTYTINSKTRGSNETITYNKYLSKSTMDEIDKVLAEHYGFTDAELDFIINYDIKYRMGRELGEDDE